MEILEVIGDVEKLGKEEYEGSKMEEVFEEKERGIDEQEKEFVEFEDVFIEVFLEEDLLGIFGSKVIIDLMF